MGSIPGSGRSPGRGYGNPLRYSCLENPRNRGNWRATVHGVTESDTIEVTYCARIIDYIRLDCIFLFLCMMNNF